MKKREEDLEASKQNLEEQLDSVIKQSQEAFTDSQVELNKHKMYSESLEKKYEVTICMHKNLCWEGIEVRDGA